MVSMTRRGGGKKEMTIRLPHRFPSRQRGENGGPSIAKMTNRGEEERRGENRGAGK